MASETEDGLALLTVAETASILGVQDEVVRQFIRAGRLGAYKLGDGPKARYRIPSSAVAEFLQAANRG